MKLTKEGGVRIKAEVGLGQGHSQEPSQLVAVVLCIRQETGIHSWLDRTDPQSQTLSYAKRHMDPELMCTC